MVAKKFLEQISISKDETEEMKKIATEIIKKIKRLGYQAKIGGSLAKGTMVKKNVQDIDIFVEFSKEEETKNLERILKKIKLKGNKIHGSRDYFQIKKNSFIIEIIPIVKFKDAKDVKNVVDFSLKHVDYIKKKINKKLAEEIKLAKVFCYANDCYGAESYVQGFSGYALELLVIYFKGFKRFLKQIQKIRVIDIEKKFKNENQIKTEVNQSKLQSPIILIDPVYKFRNVCAGLSKETFNRFLKTAKAYLKNPSEKFFVKKELDFENLMRIAKNKKAELISLKLKTDRREGDVAATKMKKFFKYLINQFEKKQQKIIRQEFYYRKGQEAEGHLIIKEKPEIEIKGPELKNKHAVQNFKRVRKKIFKKGKFAWAKEKISIKEILESSRKVGDEMNVTFILEN